MRPPTLRPQRGPFRPLRGSVQLADADRRVLGLLEQQPPRLWPRGTLAESCGLADRALRKSIERLRHAGFPVLASSSSGAGYWLARTATEVHDFRERELHSRMRVIADESRVLLVVEKLMRDRERAGGVDAPALQMALG